LMSLGLESYVAFLAHPTTPARRSC
jgi:hypothetical protein